MENKTPIQEWIEKEVTDKFCYDYSKHECAELAVYRLLAYLGLRHMTDPKKWVQQIADEREKLQAENESLKKELKVLKGETT